MPKKTQPQPQQVYKTETQLKEEARAKFEAETEAAAAIQKTEFQIKRENFWYHYKWQTIAGVIGALLLIFFIRDIFFRTKPDATIVVISKHYVDSEVLERMTASLEEFATDFNGDGKVTIATDFITLPNFEEEESTPMPDLTGGQGEMGNAMKLMAVLAAGADPIYLLDEASYAYIVSMGQDDDSSALDNIFEAHSIPFESIAPEDAAQLDGMNLYLRSTCSDENYYEYCKQFMQVLTENL